MDAIDAATDLEAAVTDTEMLLLDGELAVDGLLLESSNHAMVGETKRAATGIRCVYKPTSGERPLWDFPRGELARREVAAYVVAKCAGWFCVPPTVLRQGPAGPGMVQAWIDADPNRPVTRVFAAGEGASGWLPVLQAEDEKGRELTVAHADSDALKRVAVFDIVVNNADRKASHLLPLRDGRVLGVDHGVTFHSEPKLRTILWGWAGQRIPASIRDGLHRLLQCRTEWTATLAQYLDRSEIDALEDRVAGLDRHPVFPAPPTDRYAIPWPPL